MATTKFRGPVNSVDGFQFNGTASTVAGTRILTTAGEGSVVTLASVAGLSTVLFGFAKETGGAAAGASKLICAVETSKNGGVASSASFQVSFKVSTDSTMTETTAIMGAATIDCILIGAG